jgi:hypothetical protein
MRKILLLLSCLLLNISLVSAQWQVPSPQDLTSTPLKVGNYITYKARLGFQGATLSQIAQYMTNSSIPINVAEVETIVNTTAEILEKVELKVSVVERTNDSITLNAYLYYNSSINFNKNITKSLSTTQWEETIYPFIRPPNDSADSIMTYINPPLNYFVNLTSQMFGIDTRSWIQIKAFRTSAFYAGKYRDVNRLSVTIPHIKGDIDAVITKMNISMPTDIRDLYSRIPEMDIDYYIDWDVQYGVFVGSKLSVRFSTMSWIAYRTIETYASATNLWNASSTDVTINTLNSLMFGYSENLVTYMVKGFVFGDTNSIIMSIAYILVPLLVIGGIIVLLKKKKK